MTSYNERLDKLLLTTLQEMSRELEAYGYLDSKNYLPEKREALTSLIKELVAEARIDGAIMGAKFGNAAFRQYNIAGKPMNLDEIRDAGIKQAEDWAKRQC